VGRQLSYGSLVRERQEEQTGERELAGGASTSGSVGTLSWAATGYGYDSNAVAETRLTVPLTESVNVNLQNMLASDSSWSSIGSISAVARRF
jgi:hypothetical protein